MERDYDVLPKSHMVNVSAGGDHSAVAGRVGSCFCFTFVD